jgi:deazaflavin-dependent oxidoreductase (nitroreductase family)
MMTTVDLTSTAPAASPPPAAPADAATGLAAPPTARDAGALAIFKVLNRWFMVPVVRAGFAPWVSCPLGGYMVLVRVRGRKSGLVRETPLNYVIADGSAWVLAGFGPRTEWYRNMLADPEVEIVLPGRPPMAAVASDITSAPIRSKLIPAIIRSTIGPSLAAGLNPFATTDQAIADDMAWVPLVRLTPVDEFLEAGADDPGGRAWIWRQAIAAVATLAIARVLLRLVAGVGRAVR